MIDVMSGHGFNDGPEGHGAALRMCGLALAVLRRCALDQKNVCVPDGEEEGQCAVEVEVGVALGPAVLVEGLYCWAVFCQRLAQTEAED